MLDEYTVTTLAKLKQAELRREAAQYHRATLAERRPKSNALRRRLATVLVAVASRLVPAERPPVEGVEVSTANS